jgi:hypothetical protein
MRMAQSRDRRKGVEDIAHGSETNHEQPVSGLGMQKLIFSQVRLLYPD